VSTRGGGRRRSVDIGRAAVGVEGALLLERDVGVLLKRRHVLLLIVRRHERGGIAPLSDSE
jgi:hypothetical protein